MLLLATLLSLSNPDITRGQHVFELHCTGCHNIHIERPGSTGPALQGTPRSVVASKLLSGGYPGFYNPKRHSKDMPLFPFLEKDIDVIYAFLNAEKE